MSRAASSTGALVAVAMTLITALISISAGCYATHEKGDSWAGPEGPCDPEAVSYEAPRCEGPGRCVDVLVVMDNRETMRDEQVALFEQVPYLTEALVSGDADGDGIAEAPPVSDLHFGVVTADLGSGGTLLSGCLSPDFGDDAILGRGRTGRLSDVCGLDIPSFLAWSPGAPADAFEEWQLDAACSVAVGIFGCPYAQPLDAALKALSESAAPPRFFRDSCGHADGANGAFLRADSVLTVVIVSDHDDCSVRDPSFFAALGDRTEDPGVLCNDSAADLHDVQRYTHGLVALREDPADLIYAPVVGLPPAVVPAPGDTPDFGQILAHPDMQPHVDPTDPTHLAPSCTAGDGGGVSFPPRRYMEVAQGLSSRGAAAPVASLCEADFRPALAAIQSRL